jgi:hypothetical protein
LDDGTISQLPPFITQTSFEQHPVSRQPKSGQHSAPDAPHAVHFPALQMVNGAVQRDPGQQSWVSLPQVAAGGPDSLRASMPASAAPPPPPPDPDAPADPPEPDDPTEPVEADVTATLPVVTVVASEASFGLEPVDELVEAAAPPWPILSPNRLS